MGPPAGRRESRGRLHRSPAGLPRAVRRRPGAAPARSHSRTPPRRRSPAPGRQSPLPRVPAAAPALSRAKPGSSAGRAATAPATSAPRRQAGAVARCWFRRARRGKSPARRCLRRHAGQGGRRGEDRRETRRYRGKRICRPSDDQLGRRLLGPRGSRPPLKQKGDARCIPFSLVAPSPVTSAAARSGCKASAISSPADRSSWPRRR